MQEVFEKIINRFKKLKGSDALANMFISDVIKVIQQKAADYNDGWIPCSERLPEESLNSVIGWDSYRERCVFVQYLQGQWKLGNWEAVNITHWMNMPYQPKGE